MRNQKLLIATLFTAIVFQSCSIVNYKSLNAIDVVFAPLPAAPSGDYEAEASLEFKRNRIKNRKDLKDFKQATFSDAISPVNINLSRNTLSGKIKAALYKLGSQRAGLSLAIDPTYHLALYNLAEKYPYVDYWTNIRVERTVQGRKRILTQAFNLVRSEKKVAYIKTGIETVKIKAVGIEILTDEEFEKFKLSPDYQENIYKPVHLLGL